MQSPNSQFYISLYIEIFIYNIGLQFRFRFQMEADWAQYTLLCNILYFPNTIFQDLSMLINIELRYSFENHIIFHHMNEPDPFSVSFWKPQLLIQEGMFWDFHPIMAVKESSFQQVSLIHISIIIKEHTCLVMHLFKIQTLGTRSVSVCVHL